jgi:hypothetical protein
MCGACAHLKPEGPAKISHPFLNGLCFAKLFGFQLPILFVNCFYSMPTQLPVLIQPWQNNHREDHGSKIIYSLINFVEEHMSYDSKDAEDG